MTSSTAQGGPGTKPARQVGMITADPGSTLLALIAQTGVDFLVLDAEQTGLTVRDCADVVQRLAGSGVQVCVRVPNLAADTLISFANTGAAELVLPQVRSVDDLVHAYEITHYMPEGVRPRQTVPSSAFGTDFTQPPRLTVLFETVEALDCVRDFVKLEIFDGGWVGPTDLADELNRHGRNGPEALEEAIRDIVNTLNSAGQSVGMPASRMATTEHVFARGADRAAVYWEREMNALLTEFSISHAASTESELS